MRIGMRIVRGAAAGAALAALGACAGAAPRAGEADAAGAQEARVARDTARVRRATQSFRALEGAVAAGYGGAVPRCLAHPRHGGMGHHHLNPALLDDRVELERPEILLYARDAAGAYALTGVEYVVPFSRLPRTAAPPRVMGRELKPSDELGLWYLHVWVWRENRAGLFADWNPDVRC